MKISAFFLALLLGAAVADEPKAADPAKPAEPAKAADPAKPSDPAKPADAPAADKVFEATDLAGLKAVTGKKVVVGGTIAAQGLSKSGVQYLNFTKDYHQSLSLVFFPNTGNGTFTKEKLAEYVGKKVQVTGAVSEHTGALQIKIDALDQIKVQP